MGTPPAPSSLGQSDEAQLILSPPGLSILLGTVWGVMWVCVPSSRPVHRHGGCAAPDPTGRALWDFPVHGGHIAVWYPAVPASVAHPHAGKTPS